MSKLLLLLSISFLSTTLLGSESDRKSIERVHRDYWAAFSAGAFRTAGQYVAPTKLAEAKELFVPIFLKAATHKDARVRQLAAEFFGGRSDPSAESLTPIDVFEGVNRIVQKISPEAYESLKGSTIRINAVAIAGTSATSDYTVMLSDGGGGDGREEFVRENEDWYLLPRQDNRATAHQFESILR